MTNPIDYETNYYQALNKLDQFHKDFTRYKSANDSHGLENLRDEIDNFMGGKDVPSQITDFYTKGGYKGSIRQWWDGDGKSLTQIKNIYADRVQISKMEDSNTIQKIKTLIQNDKFVKTSPLLKTLLKDNASSLEYLALSGKAENFILNPNKFSYKEVMDMGSRLDKSFHTLTFESDEIQDGVKSYHSHLKARLDQAIRSIPLHDSLRDIQYHGLMATDAFKIGNLPIHGEWRGAVIAFMNDAHDEIEEIKKLPRSTLAEKTQYLSEITEWEKNVEMGEPLNLAVFYDQVRKEDLVAFNKALIGKLSPRREAEEDLFDSIEGSINQIHHDFNKLSLAERNKIAEANQKREKTPDSKGILKLMDELRTTIAQAFGKVKQGSKLQDLEKKVSEMLPFVPKYNPIQQFEKLLYQAMDLGIIDEFEAIAYLQDCKTNKRVDPAIENYIRNEIRKAQK